MSASMHRTRRPAPPLALLTLAAWALWACGAEEDPIEPPAGDVGIPPGDLGASVDDVSTDPTDAGPAHDSEAPEPAWTLELPDTAFEGDEVTVRAAGLEGRGGSLTWNAGTRDADIVEGPDGEATIRWRRTGRFTAGVTWTPPAGSPQTRTARVTVVQPVRWQPNHSGSLAWTAEPDGAEWLAAVSPDSDELVRWGRRDADAAWEVETTGRAATCRQPRTVAAIPSTAGPPRWAVACPSEDAVTLLTWPADGVPVRQDLAVEYGARPFGVIHAEGGLWVTLQGRGELARLRVDGTGQLVEERRFELGPDPRDLAELPGGRLAISRWRAIEEHSEVYVVDAATGRWTDTWRIEADRQAVSDTETPGVLNYLGPLVVSPWGDIAALGGTRANIFQGLRRNGELLDFDSTVQATVVFLDLDSGEELTARRKLLDNRGMVAALAWSSDGAFLHAVTRDARSVERLDRLTGFGQSGSLLDVGFAPQGIRMAPRGDRLAVDASLSRTIPVWESDAFTGRSEPLQRLRLVDGEPMDPVLLRGRILFNDSFDPRLAGDSYIACASCHLDGEADLQTWDFSDRGEGLRNTIALVGRAGMEHGPVHWSANFDEIQDFEHDLRGPFGGRGLMDDDTFFRDGRDHPLGGPKAGLSEDLDALAAYVSSLDAYPRSPWRQPDGRLPEAAERGRRVFEAATTGCAGCHAGPHLTDSAFVAPGVPLLHDVGTRTEASGSRLDDVLTGFDTPTLHDLFDSAPYLHDGSAATLREVLVTRNPEDRHGRTSHLTEAEIDDLILWLLCQDGTADEPAPEPEGASERE
jgi:hypothetical protein